MTKRTGTIILAIVVGGTPILGGITLFVIAAFAPTPLGAGLALLGGGFSLLAALPLALFSIDLVEGLEES